MIDAVAPSTHFRTPWRKRSLKAMSSDAVKYEQKRSVNDTSKLSATLAQLFADRKAAHIYREDVTSLSDLTEDERVLKTVFIKAPRTIPYGAVARVIDGVKGAGAEPLGLQIDDLN
jgi:biopolymer transport protein ExbD